MLDQVRRTIAKYGLLRGGERVIIGFSGGIDSVCLAHVLRNLTELDLKLWAAYVDYGLRPVENRREEALLQEYGARFGMETICVRVNLPERLQQKNESIQLLAREERYRFFENLKAEIGADKIALAHHRDDQAETIFLRLIRGTGIDGLAGMPVNREDGVIRPFLEVSRAAIREYMQENQLSWVEDSSNQKLIYRRNRIRHQIIPEIENTLNPRFKDALLRLGALAGEQQELMASLAEREAERILFKEPNRVGLRLNLFRAQPKYLQYHILKHALQQLRPGAQMESAPLFKLRERLSARQEPFKPAHFWKGFLVYCEGDAAFLGERPVGRPAGRPTENGWLNRVYDLTAPGAVSIPEAGVCLTVAKTGIPAAWTGVADQEAYFSITAAKLPFRVRFWRRGDWFWPLGAAGTQKLQDYFTNCKVPRGRRGEIPLLVDAADRIIWIAGYRLDDRFKVRSPEQEAWRAVISAWEPVTPAAK